MHAVIIRFFNLLPEKMQGILVFRSVFLSLLCLLVFQGIGQHIALSAWAALSAFALVQMDIQETFIFRFCYYAFVVSFITGLIYLALFLSIKPIWFIISIPVLALISGYIACINRVFFNVIAWGLCLYVVAGWKPTPPYEAMQITYAV